MFNQSTNYFEDQTFMDINTESFSRARVDYPETPELLTLQNRIASEDENHFKKQEDFNFVEFPVIKDICPDIFNTEFPKSISQSVNYYNKSETQLNIESDCSAINSIQDFSCIQSEYPNVEKRIKDYNGYRNNYYDNWNKNYTCQVPEEFKDNTYQNTIRTLNYRQNDNLNLNTGCSFSSNLYSLENNFPSQSYSDGPVLNYVNGYQLENQYFMRQNECSNDGSDIIVEDIDKDLGHLNYFNEIKEPKLKCLVCNITKNSAGIQFYRLGLKNPLTMTSQKPVVKKIKVIIKRVPLNSYICNECLGLVNSMDYLETKLEGFRNELTAKFKKTCKYNKSNIVQHKSLKLKYIISKKFSCKYCNKHISLKDYYNMHMRKHKRPCLLCEICGKIFYKKIKFKRHKNNHLKNIKEKVLGNYCTNCSKSFSSKTSLKVHQNFCLGIYPFKCDFEKCDKKYTSRSKLKSHVKLKHDKKFIAICSICNIGFIKISDYKSHMITHSTDKKYDCPKCDKSYKTLSNLNFHLKSHSKKLPFICTICQKGFMRKDYLEVHLNNHKGIRNFKCSLCSKAFASQKNLDSHLKFHDGSIQKTKCSICAKLVFNIEEHTRIHNNLQEFECNLCDCKFNTKGTLLKHRNNKHKNELG